jgi:tRNA A-37 threonylcarbamoyl transferase component Bud32
MSSISDPGELSRSDARLHGLLGTFYDEGADTDERRSILVLNHPELAVELARYFAEQDRLRKLFHPVPPGDGTTNLDSTKALQKDAASPPYNSASLDEYELIDEISQGGMGIVYRARRRDLDRIVAVKVLRPDRATDSDRIRFRNEAQAIADLDHPNIVPIYDVGPGFFAMKLLSGGSLADQLPRYSESPRQAAELMVKVARAVQHAHERGILHRDLKPSNVLLDETDEPFVGDFGLAKRLGVNLELTQSGQVLGTLNYMAPEQATGPAKDVTTRTDIWGLGTILYALLTGRPPFQSDSAAVVLRKLQEKDPERPSSLNRRVNLDLEAICLKCLEKVPGKRYPTAASLAEDLDRWLSGRPTVARPISRVRRFGRWCRRNPVMATLSAGVVILGLAVGISVFVGLVASEMHRRNAERGGFWVFQGITEPLKRLANPELAQNPTWAEARREAVTEAIEAYKQFIAPLDDSQSSCGMKINTWFHIGLLYTVLDDRPNVRQAYLNAISLAERLVRESPANAGFWDLAGMAYYHISMELWYENFPAEATAYFPRALAAFDEAQKRDPNTLIYLQHAVWFLMLSGF